jgi:hypothetical protein
MWENEGGNWATDSEAALESAMRTLKAISEVCVGVRQSDWVIEHVRQKADTAYQNLNQLYGEGGIRRHR